MIFGKISDWNKYFPTPVFKEIFNELQKFNHDTPNGVYQTHDDFYFKVMSYDSKLEATVVESHRKEVDVQILFSGEERIMIYDKEDVEVSKPYDESTDCQFYLPGKHVVSDLNLRPGYMAVFFPEDLHRPQLATKNTPVELKKIVIKINEKLFTHE